MARKIEEAALAMQLERTYSKELILELYLNTIYFGRGQYGVQAASLRVLRRARHRDHAAPRRPCWPG